MVIVKLVERLTVRIVIVKLVERLTVRIVTVKLVERLVHNTVGIVFFITNVISEVFGIAAVVQL
jgi:hypothetical protein